VIPLASGLFLPSFLRPASRRSNMVSMQSLSAVQCTQGEASNDEDETDVIYSGRFRHLTLISLVITISDSAPFAYCCICAFFPASAVLSINSKDPYTMPSATFQHPSRHVTEPPTPINLDLAQTKQSDHGRGTGKKFLGCGMNRKAAYSSLRQTSQVRTHFECNSPS